MASQFDSVLDMVPPAEGSDVASVPSSQGMGFDSVMDMVPPSSLDAPATTQEQTPSASQFDSVMDMVPPLDVAPAIPDTPAIRALQGRAPAQSPLLSKPSPATPPAPSLPQAGAASTSQPSTKGEWDKATLRKRLQDNPQDADALKRWNLLQERKDLQIQGAQLEGKVRDAGAGMAAVQNQAQQTVGGLTFGLSDIVLEKMRKAYDLDYTAQSTPEQVANSVGRMLGGVFTAQGLAQGVGGLTKKLGMEGVKQVLLTRLGTAGIAATLNAISGISTGKRDAKEASIDIAQNMAASLVGFGAETAVPAGVKNWVAQVGADLIFDITTDTARGRLDDQSFKDWFIKEELPQLAMSVAFATKDFTDKNFETQRIETRDELKDAFTQRFKKAQKDGVIAPVSKIPEGLTPQQAITQKALAESETRGAQEVQSAIDVQKKRPFVELRKEARAKGLVKQGESVDRTEMANRLAIKAVADSKVEPSRLLAETRTAQDFLKGMEENLKQGEAFAKKQTKPLLQRLKEAFVDQSEGVKRVLEDAGAQDTIDAFVTRQGASSEAKQRFNSGLHRIKSALGGESEELLANIIHAQRTVDASELVRSRGEELKTPEGIGEENSRAFLDDFNKNATPEQKAKIQAAQAEYYALTRESLDTLRDEGLISPESHAKLVSEHKTYSPRVFIDFIDPATTNIKGERVLDSGVKALDKGSESAMVTNFKTLLANVESRTQSRVFKNKANKSLAGFIRENPESNIGRIRKEGEQVGRNEGVIRAFEEGKPVEMIVPKAFAEQWEGLPPAISADFARALQIGTGTKLVKTLATGINPEFAFSNFFRDQQYAWFNSGQYSRFLPAAIAQQITDFAGIGRDAVTRKGAYLDYVKQGGGMDYLTTQGSLAGDLLTRAGKKRDVVGKVSDVLAWLGETSEIATRLAVRNRAIKNGSTPQHATFVARNMLDFSQGGRMTKAADNAIPYLNAAIQGTRGSFRAFKTDPVGSSVKASQLVAIGYSLAYGMQAAAPDLWNSISDEEKARKWIIPLPFGKKKDANGDERSMYLSIPKDQFQQVFSAMGQSYADGQAGNPWSKQITEAISSIFPVDSASWMPPIGAASLAYFHNYDTWRKEKIWKGDPATSPSNERTLTTPQIASDVSDMAKRMGVEISPDRMAVATSKMVPTSNPIASLLVDGYGIKSDTKMNNDVISKIRAVPGLRRFVRFSRPIAPSARTLKEANDFGIDTEGKVEQVLRREVDEMKRERADMRQPLNVGLDRFMRDTNPEMWQIAEWISQNASSKDEQSRLKARAKARMTK